MISKDRLEKALTFISETDEKAAELKTDVERASYKAKKVKATLFVHGEGSVEMRKALAETWKDAVDADNEYLQAHQDSQALENKRKTVLLFVDVWRSLNASRRQGNIT
jgi:hypothetical protein